MASETNPTQPQNASDLVTRLLAIRERLFWLHACWATTLSPDIAFEADRYRELFRELGDELRKQDAGALDRITAGYEALLLAEPMPKPTIPLAAQQWHEIAAEVRNERSTPPEAKPIGYVSDGLQRFV